MDGALAFTVLFFGACWALHETRTMWEEVNQYLLYAIFFAVNFVIAILASPAGMELDAVDLVMRVLAAAVLALMLLFSTKG